MIDTLQTQIKRVLDQSYGPFGDGMVDRMAGHIARLPDIADAQTRIAELEAVLEWYGENARLARLIHREGDEGRHAISSDGDDFTDGVLTKVRLAAEEDV
tara:strand:+ start:444 stop:743 length:300 start_codon:yes stop_codon:yes gene_type:complete